MEELTCHNNKFSSFQ